MATLRAGGAEPGGKGCRLAVVQHDPDRPRLGGSLSHNSRCLNFFEFWRLAGRSLLPELDPHHVGRVAVLALEGAQVMVRFARRLDPDEEGECAALRA